MFYFLFFTRYYFQNFLEKDFWNFLQKAWKIPSGLFRGTVSRQFESVDSVCLTTLTYIWSARLTDKKSRRDIFTYSHTRIRM